MINESLRAYWHRLHSTRLEQQVVSFKDSTNCSCERLKRPQSLGFSWNLNRIKCPRFTIDTNKKSSQIWAYLCRCLHTFTLLLQFLHVTVQSWLHMLILMCCTSLCIVGDEVIVSVLWALRETGNGKTVVEKPVVSWGHAEDTDSFPGWLPCPCRYTKASLGSRVTGCSLVMEVPSGSFGFVLASFVSRGREEST